MQRVCSFMAPLLLLFCLFVKPVLSFWYVNHKGIVVNDIKPQVLGNSTSEYHRRLTVTAAATTRPTTRPTATPTTRPSATPTQRPTATTAPRPTTASTSTQAPQPTNTRTPEPTTASTSTTGTVNTEPTVTVQPTVIVQPTITQTTFVQSTNTPMPTKAQEKQNQDQQANTSSSEPTATPTQAQNNNNSGSWWKAFTDNLLNKNIEPTNVPTSLRKKSKSNLPPPTNILRIENNDDQVGITQVDEQGNEKKLGDQLWLEIQSQKTAFDQTNFREEKNIDTVRLGSGKNKSIVINRNNTSAETSLPVSVDLTTNDILVETSSGIKHVASLPDQIVKSSEEAQFITSVDTSKKIELVVEDGIPVYRIYGVRMGKFFGIIPVSIHKQIFVSAEDGRLVKENLSISNQFLEKTSF